MLLCTKSIPLGLSYCFWLIALVKPVRSDASQLLLCYKHCSSWESLIIIICVHILHCCKMPTIREILAVGNPELNPRWKGTTYNNTRSKTDSYDSVIFNDIQKSTVQNCMSLITYYISKVLTLMSTFTGNDFTHDAIELAYGDILDIHLDYNKPNTPTSSPRTIKKEDDLDSILEICKRLKLSLSAGRQPGYPGLDSGVYCKTTPRWNSVPVELPDCLYHLLLSSI